jgi:hypothetical protein
MKKEKVEQRKFMRKIASAGGVIFKTHGDESSAGQPDTIGALDGRVFVIEWKQTPKDTPTKLQESILDLWQSNGVPAAVHYSCDEAMKWLYNVPRRTSATTGLLETDRH